MIGSFFPGRAPPLGVEYLSRIKIQSLGANLPEPILASAYPGNCSIDEFFREKRAFLDGVAGTECMARPKIVAREPSAANFNYSSILDGGEDTSPNCGKTDPTVPNSPYLAHGIPIFISG